MSSNKKSSIGINLSQFVSNISVRRKLIDQNDRDKFEWNQWQSATKSINNIESPAKEKHVRNLILGTYRLEGSKLFWSMMVRIQIESHPIVSWKFCYVTHRLLRDGHKNTITDTILLINYFEQLTNYWSGLQQHYGLLTYRYCHLIILKLKFHQQNPIFNGNLTFYDQTTTIQTLFQGNFNSYLLLTIELFNYLDELLNLVQVIFTSLDQSRTNSMTIPGQCRLNPLIILIQDSSIIYDYIVKIMFKLHEDSSHETLQNHRDRFNDQFRKLKRFYNQVSTLQLFKNLIQIPILPENSPNFTRKDEFKTHQTPIPIVHSASQMLDDLFIDNKSSARLTGSVDLSTNEHLANRSKEISDLEQRLTQYDAMLKQNRSETDDLHRTIAARDAELLAEKHQRLQLEEQLRQQLENQKRLEDMQTIDQKVNSDEKFNQLRQEHFAVLHRENELQKQLTHLHQQINDLKDEYKKNQTDFYENSQKLNEEIYQLRQTNDELQDRIQILTTERNDYQSLSLTTIQRMKEIEYAKQNVEERYKELDENKSQVENQLKHIEVSRRDLVDKDRENQEDLIDLIHERDMFEEKLLDLEQINKNLIEKQKFFEINQNNLKKQYQNLILTYCIKQMQDAIDKKTADNPDYLREKLCAAIENIQILQERIQSDENDSLQFLNECLILSNNMIDIVRCETNLANLTKICIDLYGNYQNGIDKKSNEFLQQLNLAMKKI